jgi:acetyl-CoA carboxylase carboxyl transferase subunit beta
MGLQLYLPAMAWWKRRDRGPTATAAEERKSVPKGVWTKCSGCSEILQAAELATKLGVCPCCGFHHVVSTHQRLEALLDPGTFEKMAEALEPLDPLGFKDSKRYKDRIKASRKKTGMTDAAIAGTGSIDGNRVAIGLLAFEYMGGSMGSVVGERVTRVFETALEQRCPAIISSASGGARMQEGILSLMQMAKTCAALSRLKAAGLPYISLLHHPTTGGVAASFSMLGDIIIAEPGALIGFAGPRVIEQTIRQKLPEGFQRSEFLLEHGMIDMIVPRSALRSRISLLLRVLGHNRQSRD